MKHYATSTLVASLMVCGSVAAAPALTGLSGTIAEGSTVTVAGSGFGTFGGEIVSWDDFEAQTLGAAINGSRAKLGGTWTTQYGYAGKGVRYDDTKVRSGSKAAHIDWSIDNTTSIKAFGWGGRGPYSRLYISYWRYMTGDYAPNTGTNYNHKQFYLFGNGGNELPQLMPLIPGDQTNWSIYNNSGDAQIGTQSNKNTKGWSYSSTRDKFQRWEFWFVQGDVNAENGTVKAWLDGQLGIENYTYKTQRTAGQWKDFRLGHMANRFTDTAKAWFDDLYVATTQARVELCDQPQWSQCATREIQIVDPASWSTGKVTFTIRRGGFSTLQGKYVYVIDSNGIANENGLPVATEPEPLPPSGVIIQ